MYDSIIESAAKIVTAYIANNSVASVDLPRIIGAVHSALQHAANGTKRPGLDEVELVPAVPVKKSVTSDFIICLEDGKKFKSLKRHLQATHGMAPGVYRAKWGLPENYPMVAPKYASSRSAVAKAIGLGRTTHQRRKVKKPAPTSR